MLQDLSVLSRLEYPGRLIILGRDEPGLNVIAVYAVTGRSPSSQARRMVVRGRAVWVEPTDEEVLKKGNPDLLIYPAFIFGREGLAVSNGKQSADIGGLLDSAPSPIDALSRALSGWDYEPDAPNFTPRISGCALAGRKAALSLIRRGPRGASLRSYFEVPETPGWGKMISTYLGPNSDPLPSFQGEPVDVPLRARGAGEAAEAVYAALKPAAQAKDFRVAVACVFARGPNLGNLDIHIVNRNERT